MSNSTSGNRPPLFCTLRSDGGPAWEPPIIAYSDMIDEEYEKNREAAMKYTCRDAAKATEIMDLWAEQQLSRGIQNGHTKNSLSTGS